MSQERRRRYYAYPRLDGSMAWLTAADHDYLTRYPVQVRWHQLAGHTGQTRLMTREERARAHRPGVSKSDTQQR